jgi:hypothetical protein
MKKWKIYLDLDGVICNFEKKFVQYYGPLATAKRDAKEWNKDWEDFIIHKKGFEQLEWFPGGQDLLKYLVSTKMPIEILSSSGGEKFHGEVTAQKIHWLRKHGIQYKANIVPGRKKKAAYANDAAILIDDTEDNIHEFNQAGGVGILHKDSGKTIKTLKELLEKH